jgi:hypothetical protein
MWHPMEQAADWRGLLTSWLAYTLDKFALCVIVSAVLCYVLVEAYVKSNRHTTVLLMSVRFVHRMHLLYLFQRTQIYQKQI